MYFTTAVSILLVNIIDTMGYHVKAFTFMFEISYFQREKVNKEPMEFSILHVLDNKIKKKKRPTWGSNPRP